MLLDYVILNCSYAALDRFVGVNKQRWLKALLKTDLVRLYRIIKCQIAHFSLERSNVKLFSTIAPKLESYSTVKFSNILCRPNRISFDCVVHVGFPCEQQHFGSVFNKFSQSHSIVFEPHNQLALESIVLIVSGNWHRSRKRRRHNGTSQLLPVLEISLDEAPRLLWSDIAEPNADNDGSSDIESTSCSTAQLYSGVEATSCAFDRQQSFNPSSTAHKLPYPRVVACQKYEGNYLFAVAFHYRREFFSNTNQ